MDNLIESLAAVIIFASLVAVSLLLFNKFMNNLNNKKISQLDIFSVALSYVNSVPGDFNISLPVYIIYTDEGTPDTKFGTELKLDLNSYRILYGPCIYHDVWKEFVSDFSNTLFDLAFAATGGIGRGMRFARLIEIGRDLGLGFIQGYVENLIGPRTSLELAMQESGEFMYTEAYAEMASDIERTSKIKSIATFALDMIIMSAPLLASTGVGLVVIGAAVAIRSLINMIDSVIRYFDPEKKCFNDAQWEFAKAYTGYFYGNPYFQYRTLQKWILQGSLQSSERPPAGDNYLLVNGFISPIGLTFNNKKVIGAASSYITIEKDEKSRIIYIVANLTLLTK